MVSNRTSVLVTNNAHAASTAPGRAEIRPAEPTVLSRGQVIDVPIAEGGNTWTLRATWSQLSAPAVDLVAFLLGSDERVTTPTSCSTTSQNRRAPGFPRMGRTSSRSPWSSMTCPSTALASSSPLRSTVPVPPSATSAPSSWISPPGRQSSTAIRSTLDAATVERTLLLAELYLRGEDWRLRAVGQGYETDLAELARRYGVDVDE